jgi:hypothetical protein
VEAVLKHLIIGAGATLAEALALGIPREKCPPVMTDFARKTWANYTPYPLLEQYLNHLGYSDLGDDPRELFYSLEEAGAVNIERFMEYCWENRQVDMRVSSGSPPKGYISGLGVHVGGTNDAVRPSPEGYWENLLYHGIGAPLQFMMLQCFYYDGWSDLTVSKKIARSLSGGDLVLNLNYDTVFELSLQQLEQPFVYTPNMPREADVAVCKPHGSLNLVSNDRQFTFGQPAWLGIPQPPGYRSFSGLVPPRLNKRYDQHPISKMMVRSVRDRAPDMMIFWGVGLTESDIDLLELYRLWTKRAPEIVVINPNPAVATKVAELIGLPVRQVPDLAAWDAHTR